MLKMPHEAVSERELQAMWRWIDEDASGQVSVGEFVRLMRKGWAGYLSATASLPRSSMLLKPSWNPCLSPKGGGSSLREQTGEMMSLEEKRRYVIDTAVGSARDSARSLTKHAKRLEDERRDVSSSQTRARGPRATHRTRGLASARTLSALTAAARPTASSRTSSRRVALDAQDQPAASARRALRLDRARPCAHRAQPRGQLQLRQCGVTRGHRVAATQSAAGVGGLTSRTGALRRQIASRMSILAALPRVWAREQGSIRRRSGRQAERVAMCVPMHQRLSLVVVCMWCQCGQATPCS